jgi:hypothetical protein
LGERSSTNRIKCRDDERLLLALTLVIVAIATFSKLRQWSVQEARVADDRILALYRTVVSKHLQPIRLLEQHSFVL